MVEDMRLRGFSRKTQESYLHAVASLARHYGSPPDRFNEEQVRGYLLFLVQKKKVAPSTFRVHLCGIKFFYENTLRRPWPLFDLARPKKRKKLPVILSCEEVRFILSLIQRPAIRMCLTLIYSCGLRLSEGARLQVEDIDGDRMQVLVRNGKGGKDRYVPLAECILERLRAYWSLDRPRPWLFPGRDGRRPLSHTTYQKAFKMALLESGIRKAASVHTLRHSYATHLMERGVPLHVVQRILGHGSPKTTTIYTHVTQKIIQDVRAALDHLTVEL
jgi:site-specific recombinase XerD